MPARSEVLAFLAAIRANPEDDAPRLMLADWLTEHGDPRGDFVRLQVLAAPLPFTDPGRRRMEKQAERLREKYDKSWLGPLGKFISGHCHTRGLVNVSLPPETFVNKTFAAVATTEAFAWVDGLAFHGPLTRTAIQKIVSSPLRSQINQLELYGSVEDRGVAALAASPYSRCLTSLWLPDCQITSGGAWAIANSRFLGQLRELCLQPNEIGWEGAWAIVDSPYFPQLHTLIVGFNNLQDRGVGLLAETPRSARLRCLDLNANGITDKGAMALASSPYLANLESLVLEDNEITRTGLKALAESPYLRQGTHLGLRGNPIGRKKAREIFGDRLGVSVFV